MYSGNWDLSPSRGVRFGQNCQKNKSPVIKRLRPGGKIHRNSAKEMQRAVDFAGEFAYTLL
jgi:hypothetical protein